MANEENNAAAEANQPEFGIQRIYVKDVSYEAPKTPGVFLKDWEPELHMDLNTKASRLDGDHHEVVLVVTVQVKMKEETIFLIEVQQAGIFLAKGFSDEEMRPMLGSFCPNVLYPYAREAVTDLVVRGGFPQLYLAPVNFDALYQQNEQEEAEETSETQH